MPKKKLKKEEQKSVKAESVKKYFYGTGSRKSAIARVRIYPGKGKITINSKEITKPEAIYLAPFIVTGNVDKFDVSVIVRGGGVSSQKEAIRHGISRALVEYNKDLKQILRKSGYLTRDPREKERKKPGLKRARRAPQWQKR